MTLDTDLKNAVVRVGDGQGFIVEIDHQRLIITAAHCLPDLPPAHGGSNMEERTYAALLGRLDEPASTVWAECLFADPVADIAVLGSPDNQTLYDEALAYEVLTEDAPALSIGEAAKKAPAWLLSLDGRWVSCTIDHIGGWALWIENAAEGIKSGMSGSPIISDEMSAIGVVSMGEGGPNARLTHNLPGWLLRR
jgi:hypothetical protein